jgi:hypothetical protein
MASLSRSIAIDTAWRAIPQSSTVLDGRKTDGELRELWVKAGQIVSPDPRKDLPDNRVPLLGEPGMLGAADV